MKFIKFTSVISLLLFTLAATALGNGSWSIEDNSANQTSTPGFAGDVDTYCLGFAVWAWDKTRSSGLGAETDATAHAYLPIQSCVCTTTKSTGDMWYSIGYYRLDISWNPATCPGGDAASQNHGAPTNNSVTWTITGDAKAAGYLDADNCDIDAGKAQVAFTAVLDGANICGDLEAEVTTETSTLEEGESVTVSGKVEKGGSGGGISWTPNQGDESSLNAHKSDTVGDTEAVVDGSRFHIAGTSGAFATIIDNANNAQVHAWTELRTISITMNNGGTHDSCCDGLKPHPASGVGHPKFDPVSVGE